jgi:F-type H+-transporting ATPase subunit epsilon
MATATATKALSGNVPELQVVVVTPTGPVVEEPTTGVTAPGELGQFEVRPGHVPFLTKLLSGVLVLSGHGKPRIFAIGPGILEVDREGVVRVLAERAMPSERIDIEAARAEVEATEPVLKDWKRDKDAEYQLLKSRYDWAKAQVEAHNRARG